MSGGYIYILAGPRTGTFNVDVAGEIGPRLIQHRKDRRSRFARGTE